MLTSSESMVGVAPTFCRAGLARSASSLAAQFNPRQLLAGSSGIRIPGPTSPTSQSSQVTACTALCVLQTVRVQQRDMCF
jgi:hypothetical protein